MPGDTQHGWVCLARGGFLSEVGPAEMSVSTVLLLTSPFVCSARLNTAFVLRRIPGLGCEIDTRGQDV